MGWATFWAIFSQIHPVTLVKTAATESAKDLQSYILSISVGVEHNLQLWTSLKNALSSITYNFGLVFKIPCRV
jgi:hypothetical protein